MRCVLALVALLVTSDLACAQFPLPGWSGTKSPVISQNRGTAPLSRCPSSSEAIPVGVYQYINTCAPSGQLTLTLPPASSYTGSSNQITISDTSGALSNTNYISVGPAPGDTILGSTSAVAALLSAPSGSAWITLRSDGVNKWTVASRSTDVQTFAGSFPIFNGGGFTWLQPLGVQLLDITVGGAGGGGGGGAKVTAATGGSGGGGGGGGGAKVHALIAAVSNGATGGATVGAGGTPGTGSVTNNTNGTDGAVGGTSNFSVTTPGGTVFLYAYGGGGGGRGRIAGGGAGGGGGGCGGGAGGTGGSSTAGTACGFQAGNAGGVNAATGPTDVSAVSAGAGGGSTGPAGATVPANALDGSGGGGGGGGVTSGGAATSATNGGWGLALFTAGIPSGPACSPGVASSGVGTAFEFDLPGCGGAGGKGAIGTNAADTGGWGANGGGGGGGGSSLNGGTSGDGGTGGPGFISVKSW
jgi:hypothetical protein